MSESPGRISPETGKGRMRTSPAALRLATADLRVEVPASDQSLGPAFSVRRRELVQILRTIHIHCNAGQFEYDTRQPGCLSCRQVWPKAIVAEAQGEQVTGGAQGGVGAASGRICYQYRSRCWS